MNSSAADVRRELSGITPSGSLTLGNYLGALRRFREHQDRGFYFVADLHALTTSHEPSELRARTSSTAALFFASGLDPDRATVFVQSDVPEHVLLSYLLECTAHVGELNRMIQFKEKGGRPGTRASLFTYPCLMAADILLYDTDSVPVGSDQSQHVELARDLAGRFNAAYGDTFRVPRLAPEQLTSRVVDLADPTRKMSKSAPADAPGVIRMLDTPDVIRRKVRKAVTDSSACLTYDPIEQPGLANLAEIVASIVGLSPTEVLEDCASYGDLKAQCADAIIAELQPIQLRHDELIADQKHLQQLLDKGAAKARLVAGPVLARAQSAFGIYRVRPTEATARNDRRGPTSQ